MIYFKAGLCPVCTTRTTKQGSLAALSKQMVKSDFKVPVVSEENRFRMMESTPHLCKCLKHRGNQKVYKKKYLSSQEFLQQSYL